jgi:hypothetical protein
MCSLWRTSYIANRRSERRQEAGPPEREAVTRRYIRDRGCDRERQRFEQKRRISMFKTLAIAAFAIGATAAVTAPAMADRICGQGFYYRYHECRPYAYSEAPGYYYGPGYAAGSAVNGAGYVAGSAVNAAGNVAGAAIGTAGAIVGGVLGR